MVLYLKQVCGLTYGLTKSRRWEKFVRIVLCLALALGLALPVATGATTTTSKAGVNVTRPCGEVVDGDHQHTGRYVGLHVRVANNDRVSSVTVKLTLELSAVSHPLSRPTMMMGKPLAQPKHLPRVPICAPSAAYAPINGAPCQIKPDAASAGKLRWACSVRVPAYTSREVQIDFANGFGRAGQLDGSFWGTAGKITSARVPVVAQIIPA